MLRPLAEQADGDDAQAEAQHRARRARREIVEARAEGVDQPQPDRLRRATPATWPMTRLQAPAPASASAMLTTPLVSPPASWGQNSVRNSQRAAQPVLVRLAERGERELQGQHAEQRHDLVARADLRRAAAR